MNYMIFASEDEAIAYSQAEAERRGCFGDATKYWWSWITHEDGRAALRSSEQVDNTWITELDESWFPKTDEI